MEDLFISLMLLIAGIGWGSLVFKKPKPNDDWSFDINELVEPHYLTELELLKVRNALSKQIRRKWCKQPADSSEKILFAMMEFALVIYLSGELKRTDDVIEVKYHIAKITNRLTTVERQREI